MKVIPLPETEVLSNAKTPAELLVASIRLPVVPNTKFTPTNVMVGFVKGKTLAPEFAYPLIVAL
jgi:hypothetical protein